MRTGCRRNVASPPACTSLLSVGWDAIRPPRRRHCCHCRAAISTVAHPRYPPDADPGHARRCVSCCCRRRRCPLPPLPAASRGRRNAASPPACASPSSAGWWDAIRPPQRHRRCRQHAAISAVAHSQYPPDTDPGHARQRVHHQRHRRRRPLSPLPAAGRGTGMACPAPPTSRRCRSHRLHILPRVLTSLTLAANDDAMPTILSRSSTRDKSAPPRTKEIVPLSPLPRPPSSPFALISTPPGMLPLKPCSVNNPTRVHPQDVV